MTSSKQNEEEICFLRTDDYVCLSCVGHGQAALDRYCLAASGFGNRMCFLETVSRAENPADLSLCTFVLEQALSVRALQEMVSANNKTEGSGQSGHRTLLYGHAVLLKHLISSMYLSCLSTSTSSDKLAFDVGLTESSHAESCWWTIHPASKQRSEGEKVRIGDDLILVSVSSERYLHLSMDHITLQQSVIASFQQTLWGVIPVSSGGVRQKSPGAVLGGDVLRLFHGDECLTVAQNDNDLQGSYGPVMYEIGAVSSHARSLWRLEHIKTKWSGGFFEWGIRLRLRHVTSGRFLGIVPGQNEVITVHRSKGEEAATAFFLRQSKDDKKKREEREEDGMGNLDLMYGDSIGYLQHCATGMWLSYETYETKKRGVGRVEEKKAVLLAEGHMDDGFTLARAQDEESNSANAIRRCASVFNGFISGLDGLMQEGSRNAAWSRVSMAEVVRCLEDLMTFFVQPDGDVQHEEKQAKLKALRNRQDLFQEEGMISLVLATIDKFTGAFRNRRDFVQAMGEDKIELFDQLSNFLYLLLAAMIRGNRANCSQFAQCARLDWLFNRLEMQQSAEGVLDILHCVLTDSLEALNLITDTHIRTLIGLLDKQGRDPRVLQVLCSLCMGKQGGAVRLNQNLIYDNLLPDRDLLLQTRLVDQTGSMRPNLFVGIKEGGATYRKWYYEVVIDSIETMTNNEARLRVGWANTDGFYPFPGGGSGWGAMGVGDDLFSYSFDGQNLWTGGKPKRARQVHGQLERGDVIGCVLDLGAPVIKFSVNGTPVKGYFQGFNTTGMFFPCISMSAKVSVRFVFGGNQGRLKYGPPEGYSAMYEALWPRERLRIEPCFNFGQLDKSIFSGPIAANECIIFIPNPVDTSQIHLPVYVENVRDKLAENIHEMWAMRKIDQGWTFGDRRDDQRKKHPCLTTFERLPPSERQYDITLAYETLRTLVALGYAITYEQAADGSRIKSMKLPNSFLQSNGYRPQPLDLSGIKLPDSSEALIDHLAENTHNVWARDRIKQGWTYGHSEEPQQKRSPHLVPYARVDPLIKRSNRETGSETIKTLTAYGYTIEPPTADAADSSGMPALTRDVVEKIPHMSRTYRVQLTWAVTGGKWYYEVEILTVGFVRLGWCEVSSPPNSDIGSHITSYAFDVFHATKWHQESTPFGKVCQPGDVIGCMLDLQDNTITFSLNGELLMDPMGQEIAFKDVQPQGGFVPAFTLGAVQQVKINFGNDVNTLKFFTSCGLQEGYEPFCVNMCRTIPMWYAREDPSSFINVEKDDPYIEIQTATGTTPTLKLISRTFGIARKDEMEFLRLSLPVRCKDHFTTRSIQERRTQLETLRRQYEPEVLPGGPGGVGDIGSTMDRSLMSGMQDMGGSSLEVPTGDKRKKMRLGNPFRKKGRDASPDVTGRKRHEGRAFAFDESDYQLAEMQARENSIADYVDEFYFSVLVLPGQDPTLVWVGWVSSCFKLSHFMADGSFDVRQCSIVSLDNDYSVKSTITERSAYVVNLGELLARFGTQEDNSKRMSQGGVIGCYLDSATGTLGFELNGREMPVQFKVEPMTRLHPAILVRPTAREMAQFELTRTRFTLPVTAGMLRHPRQATPQLPPRLKIQAMTHAHWSRVAANQVRVHTLKLSDVRGWSMLCEDPVQMLAVHVPEEDRCLDILEMDEHKDLLKFHSDTLTLYRALCCHGNHNVAHNLVTHADDKQLIYIILSQYLSGPLRTGFFDLIIAMHLESHTRLKIVTQEEFLVPLHQEDFQTGSTKSVEMHTSMDSFFDFHKIPAIEEHTSIRPALLQSPAKTCKDEDGTPRYEECPPFPLARLKDIIMRNLVDAVNNGSHIRDPIGGSNEFLYVPLLRVLDNLLVMGMLKVDESAQLMAILDPDSFPTIATVDLPIPKVGLLASPVDEPVQLELCHLLSHLCDLQLRNRVEGLVHFANDFVSEIQNDQLRRYLEIKQSNLPSSIAAKKTREFRCPPIEQMRTLLVETEEDPEELLLTEGITPTTPLLNVLGNFHRYLMDNCGVEPPEEEEDPEEAALRAKALARSGALVPFNVGNPEHGGPPARFVTVLMNLVGGGAKPIEEKEEEVKGERNGDHHKNLSQLIIEAVIRWAKDHFIENLTLIREMFRLIYRQYNALGELQEALEKTYVISHKSVDDVSQLVRSLGRVRCLLGVQVNAEEEKMLKSCLWDIMNNKVFFQHPNLTRCLAVHETVMQLMVHTLNKASLDTPSMAAAAGGAAAAAAATAGTPLLGDATNVMGNSMESGGGTMPAVAEENFTPATPTPTAIGEEEKKKTTDSSTEMVVQCCRFLCYFCRTSRENQKAMFDHLSYMLDNSAMLLGARPSLRGTCPLDVAFNSLMDNNELALALREPQLEKVASYLSRCGVQSNAELLHKGYPDIGWDPVEGERFLDFLRFTVWVNGESVEDNANLVVRLLIRRPECLGPALRGGTSSSAPGSGSGGGGLLKAMKEGIVMSAQIKLTKISMEREEDQDKTLPIILADYEDANLFAESPYDFTNLPPEDDEDYVDLGSSILNFYSCLVDVLGRSAPEPDTNKSDSLRVRSILRSLVSIQDLEGVLSLRFILPAPQMELTTNAEGADIWKDKAGLPPGLLPEHKACVVLFLERVYGIEDAATFLRLLENAFLPDLRAATVLDAGPSAESDMALALNRYLGSSVFPLLTVHAHFLSESENSAPILDALLQTTYRLSRCRALTKNQREIVSDFLVALTVEIQPPMMTKLLKKLVIDVPSLTPESVVPLRLLTVFYQRCGRYYSASGWAGVGVATEEERQLTSILFTRIFDNLALRPYDPELFSKALPCLSAIGCALSPDYTYTQPISRSASQVNTGGHHQNQMHGYGDPSSSPGAPDYFQSDTNSLVGGSSLLSPRGGMMGPRPGGSTMDLLGGMRTPATAAGLPLISEEDYDAQHQQQPGAPPKQIPSASGIEDEDSEGNFLPNPVDLSCVRNLCGLDVIASHLVEHMHDSWAMELIDQGWVYGPMLDEARKVHPNLKPFHMLSKSDAAKYHDPVMESMKAMIALGWSVDTDDSRQNQDMIIENRRRPTVIMDSPHGYVPAPKDLRGVNVTREMTDMGERLAKNAHNSWAVKKREELEDIGGGVHQLLVPYDLLTSKEKQRYRRLTHELLKYLQLHGVRVSIGTGSGSQERGLKNMMMGGHRSGVDLQAKNANQKSTRFAFSLLSKLLEYVERAMATVHETKESERFSRSQSYTQSSQDMKFFGKVVLPLVERYFAAHNNYFVGIHSNASIEEKKMAATLFCKLFTLLRLKITAFGHDVNISVCCLQGLVQAIDCKAVCKMQNPMEDFVRVRLLPFFINCADDLTLLIRNLARGRYSHVKGTIQRGATSINYVHMVLLPVLKAMFEHLNKTQSGTDLLIGDVQVACYRILNALYVLGTKSAEHSTRQSFAEEFNRHRPLLGETIAAFASTFPVAFLEPKLNKNNKNSIMFDCEGDYSLEAREILSELDKNLPVLETIVEEIAELAESGGKYLEAPHVIEVTLPMLCSYLPVWWLQGPDNCSEEGGNPVTSVTAVLMNTVLGNVLKLIRNNINSDNAPWMTRIATRTQPIVGNATADMLGDHFLPVAEKLRQHALSVDKEEELFQADKKSGSPDAGDREEKLTAMMEILVRNLFAFYPLLIRYVDLHRTAWLKSPTRDTEKLFQAVAEIFLIWTKSAHFKREEQTFVRQNEIDHLSLIMPGQTPGGGAGADEDDSGEEEFTLEGKRKGKKSKMESFTSLNVACIKRLLPIGLGLFGGREQELVQKAKQKMIEASNTFGANMRENNGEIEEYLTQAIDKEDEDSNIAILWQKMLYRKIGQTRLVGEDGANYSKSQIISKVINMAKVLQGLYLVDHPPSSLKSAWKKIISSQRKRAVMACFRMIPLHAMPRHRVINLFLLVYKKQWLIREDVPDVKLIEDLTASMEEPEEATPSGGSRGGNQGTSGSGAEADKPLRPDPLSQLIKALSRGAMEQCNDDSLYIAFASIMGKSCSAVDEDDDDEGGDEEGGPSLEEQESEKQQILSEQARLADRGAAEMVLLQISASGGEKTDVVIQTIELGISLLLGGNMNVQGKMLAHLKEKKDVGFFMSISGLMTQCSVLDLDTFERCNKADAVGSSDMEGITNLYDAEFTCKIFRFLQLLCEGHNIDFQDYLRSQDSNTISVNIIICTVDYLLRLQESIMDFYWHYCNKDTIDEAGKRNFVRAIYIGKQIFRSLTEYIQGPCVGNQLALAHSRLWDAIGGFLYIFANMQDKLSKDPMQLELLREFMKLQKEMMIMLLSMLEGNVVNGPIGRQMVDTLVESSANVEMIVKFFDIFLRMKDITSSEAFLTFDINGDGYISHKEFRRAMELQKMYSEEEINYIMMCVDSNNDGKVDFNEFTNRFHGPAKDIGFNVAVLFTNLYEHMPNDPRLERLVSKAKRVLDVFEPYLGRIEIMGSAGRIERVYYEIKQMHIDQWNKPQIKESKRSFLHSVVNEGGDKEKLESFVNFCEDTIFEMQHDQVISGEGEGLTISQVAAVRNMMKSGPVQMMGSVFSALFYCFKIFTLSNIRSGWSSLMTMSPKQIILGSGRFQINFILLLMSILWHVTCVLGRLIKALVIGPPTTKELELNQLLQKHQAWLLPEEQQLALERLDPTELSLLDERVTCSAAHPLEIMAINGIGALQQPEPVAQTLGLKHAVAGISPAENYAAQIQAELENVQSMQDSNSYETERKLLATSKPAQMRRSAALTKARAEAAEENKSGEGEGEEDEAPIEARTVDTSTYVISIFARNFYLFKLFALTLAFLINFMLLFYKVEQAEGAPPAENGEGDEVIEAIVNATEAAGEAIAEAAEEVDPEEWLVLSDTISYMGQLIKTLAALHTLFAFSMLVAYYCLKIPLVIFKHEKEVCRMLEFEGMWISEQPSDDNLFAHWDKLVLSTKSFPLMFWDKFVKKKVRNKYSEQYDFDQITTLLGMGTDEADGAPTKKRFLPNFVYDLDLQYHVWKWGVVFTDNSFLYLVLYFLTSFIGNFNYFFFACHLLDVAISVKTLKTILQSVTHNGKQLVLTVLLTCVVIYLYTVIAFNFFRKFYVKDGDAGEKDLKCHDMLTCFIFHLHTGLRAGGGIGDEIESPDGDAYEAWRILFDLTFFFFVIVILLAIIQGLIIDAFGELRDQLEQVKEDMESKCFICGIGKEYFDKIPRGFEQHVEKEHNFANYMFFLMHLINKPDTEYTGQETYVWELYQQRCWDFFPVGDCFRKQYEEELQS